jgi:hypothetical protein
LGRTQSATNPKLILMASPLRAIFLFTPLVCLAVHPAERKEKKTINDRTTIPRTMMMRQGMAPWRGIMDVGVEAVAFFLIFAELIARAGYFLNKLSKAARASLELRGAGVFSSTRFVWLAGTASRATVTIGEKYSHVLAWSFSGMRTSMGLWH